VTAKPPRAPAAAPKDVQARAPAPKPVQFPPASLKEECDRIVALYPTRQAALLPVLHVAQAHYDNWISPEVEAGVAEYIGVSAAHVRGVLTFYAMYNTEPAGRHEVWVCRTLTCWLHGAQDLRRTALEKSGTDKAGMVGEDGKFLVKDMECLGLCEVAPAVFVDGQAHVKVTCEKLAALMDACE
jgi:NADH-quinone oxidoreductase subunit E